MKNKIQILMLIICCCCQSKKKDYNLNWNGFWESSSKVILIKDSVLMHPYFDAPGFYHFEVRNDSLIILDRNKTEFYKYDFKCKILPTDSDGFMLIYQNDTLKYERIKPLISKRFKKLTFEARQCEGDCPVFKMILFPGGKLLYSGERNTKIIGDHQFRLDSQTVMETNQLLNILEINKYPANELPPPADNPRINMTVEYFDGKTIEIKDGLFEGKYWNLIKYFYGFDTLIKLQDFSQNSSR